MGKFHKLHKRRWAAFATEIKAQRGHRCQRCGAGGSLEAHHIIPAGQAPGRAFDPSNIEVLCRDCHIEHHRKPRSAAVAAWDNLLKGLRA